MEDRFAEFSLRKAGPLVGSTRLFGVRADNKEMRNGVTTVMTGTKNLQLPKIGCATIALCHVVKLPII